ncbi:hypothetical protein BCR44DRAFT_125147 [Catenaria anguillulae PL171]|uniref:Anti-proliferative protein domain-containing protein n=1 Tax=Catenaria anguillulae PL171 TaxID=765915 RepID=A0A1Y2HJV4_9FUNG|nr:hypothetical protein BCR44DRAFT_125147 [Catenaria anguillulae PL171]
MSTTLASPFESSSSSTVASSAAGSPDRSFLTGAGALAAGNNNNGPHATVPQRRRSSASSTASLAALASAATYTQQEVYSFLLVSKELAAAAEFVCQLLELGGLNDDILLNEFKTILVDLMAERFSEVWDIRAPKKGAGFRTLTHSPNLPKHHVDPILNQAFILCNIHPKHLPTLLPVSFSLTINPGLVAYTTSDVEGFQPVHLFEARPYLPPKHQEPVDHGAEIRQRAMRSLELGHGKLDEFDVDAYFGQQSGIPARRPSLAPQ